MRVISYSRSGGPDVLELLDAPVPEPGPSEVRVRVAYSGVNPTDWKSRSSAQPGPDGQVPNQDGAGTVDAVGAGVDPVLVRPGSRCTSSRWPRRPPRTRRCRTALSARCWSTSPREWCLRHTFSSGFPLIHVVPV